MNKEQIERMRQALFQDNSSHLFWNGKEWVKYPTPKNKVN